LRERLLKEEGGFTLPEVLVAMVMMVTVMFALYAIFDMSLRVFSFGNDKVEAVENARAGLERMEREIRAAYPEDKAEEQDTRLSTWGSDKITFGNDVETINRQVDSGEEITYEVSGTTLLRNSQPVVEFVQDVDGDGEALTFEYLDEQGEDGVSSEEDIEIVHVKLEIEVDGRSQILETDIALRNEGG
jgi:prepilin-type N-terminal cleavage/methylation domain-containing protein